MQQEVNEYETACVRLALKFVEKYYCDEDLSIDDMEFWWPGDIIGGVLAVNDHFWDMESIVEAIRINAPEEKLFNWYDSMDADGKRDYNMRSFLRLK